MKKNLIWKKRMALLLMVIAAFQSMSAYAANSTTIYHTHTGNGSDGGGCYGEAHTQSHTKRCNQHFSKVNWCTIVCGAGHTQTNTVDGGYDSWPIPSKCDVVTGSYTTTYYTINCDMEGRALANLWIEEPTAEWTKELILTPEVELLDGTIRLEENPFVWDGGMAEGNTLKVTENGTYTCQLNIKESSDAADKTISVTVTNIDHKGPQITKKEYDGEQCLSSTLLTIEAEDLQEDGSLGAGLHEQPYSYDGGETWTAENVFEIKENGEHLIVVRDSLENETTETICVNNLDTVGPRILNIGKSPSEETYDGVEVMIEAEDLKNEQEEGIGLHESAYSFDGGNTWQESNVYYFTKNGTFIIGVRDKFENITTEEIIINNIKVKPPVDNSSSENVNPVSPVPEESTEKMPEEETTEEETTEEPVQESVKEGNETKGRKDNLPEESEEQTMGDGAKEDVTIENEEQENNVKKERKTYQVKPKVRLKEAPVTSVKSESRRVNEKIVKAVTYVSEVVALASGTALLMYLYLFTVLVYGKKGGKYHLLGITLLKKEKDFYVNLPKNVQQRNESIYYLLHMNYFVAKRYFLETILIQSENWKIRKEIEHQIMFEKTEE